MSKVIVLDAAEAWAAAAEDLLAGKATALPAFVENTVAYMVAGMPENKEKQIPYLIKRAMKLAAVLMESSEAEEHHPLYFLLMGVLLRSPAWPLAVAALACWLAGPPPPHPKAYLVVCAMGALPWPAPLLAQAGAAWMLDANSSSVLNWVVASAIVAAAL